MPIKLHAAALTDQGHTREDNQDTVYQKVIAAPEDDAAGLFIVADGIGGRLAGEAASFWAVEAIKGSLSDLFALGDPRDTVRFKREELVDAQTAPPSSLDTVRFKKDELVGVQAQIAARTDSNYLTNRLRAAVNRANNVVREYASQNLDSASDIGTTVSLAIAFGRNVLVGNVGDSRTYLMHEGELHQITKDHSFVQRLIEGGYIGADERFNHPYRSLIFRSLGTEDTVEVDTFTLTLSPGDFLLLCTDGLWEMVQSPVDLARIIQMAPSVEEACESLVAAANASGGEDNIGVVLVQVSEG